MAFGFSAEIAAQNLVGIPTRGTLGLKAGVLSRMTVESGMEMHTEIASTAQVFGDFPKGRGWSLSTAFDFHYVEINRSNQVMIEPSLGFKKEFHLRHQKMILKPGAAIGFAYLSDIGDLPSSQYLSYHLLFEAHFQIDGKKAWLAELAFFHAPSGSRNGESITLGPGLMFRVGLAFH